MPEVMGRKRVLLKPVWTWARQHVPVTVLIRENTLSIGAQSHLAYTR